MRSNGTNVVLLLRTGLENIDLADSGSHYNYQPESEYQSLTNVYL